MCFFHKLKILHHTSKTHNSSFEFGQTHVYGVQCVVLCPYTRVKTSFQLSSPHFRNFFHLKNLLGEISTCSLPHSVSLSEGVRVRSNAVASLLHLPLLINASGLAGAANPSPQPRRARRNPRNPSPIPLGSRPIRRLLASTIRGSVPPRMLA